MSCTAAYAAHGSVEPGATLAIDCEGLELIDRTGWEKIGLGEATIVNERLEVV